MGAVAVVQPLLSIETLNPPLPDLTRYAALAFTSGHGVQAFSRLTTDRTLPVFAVGDTTADMARARGFRTVHSAAGDAEALATMLDAAGLTGPVLSPGAQTRAADLAQLVRTVSVDVLELYRTIEAVGIPDEDIDVILVQSRRAAEALLSIWPAGRPFPTVVALSAAAAHPLDLAMANGAQIHLARHPNEDALIEALGKALTGV